MPEPRVNVRGIKPETWRRIKVLAAANAMSAGEIVEQALVEFADKMEELDRLYNEGWVGRREGVE